VYIADTGGARILKVTPQGAISTVAGGGQCCGITDGVPAIGAFLAGPLGVVVDQSGVIYFTEESSRVRRVGTDGIIITIAGGKGVGYSGDGGPAVAATLNQPSGIALDSAGNLYISDTQNNRIRRVTPDGIIRTIAGTGVANFTGDGGHASLATLNEPAGIALDGSGNVYIADSLNFRVRRVDPAGTISTYAGNGNLGFTGDGGPARDAVLGLSYSSGVLVDPSGNVYVCDAGNNRVRKIAPNDIITTVAGGAARGFAGDGGPATQALLNFAGFGALALDGAGNLYIADSGNLRVRKVDSSGTITTFAGNGTFAANGSGDGGPAVSASFASPRGLAFDAKGNLYIVDGANIRVVSPFGTITAFASGLLFTGPIAVDAVGNVYASVVLPQSVTGGKVIRISPDGKPTDVVSNTFGTGQMAFDSQGNMYVPDTHSSVFLVSPTGTQTVVAGTAQPGFSGDDGPAALAQLNEPTAVTLDSAGNLYIADSGNGRIRKVFLNPASGLFQPTLQTTLQPGYYIATVTLGQGEHPGYWGMQVVAPVGVLAGGFNLGGTIQQRSLPPGFGAVYVPLSEAVHFHVDAQAADGSSNSTVGLGVQLLDASRNPVIGEQFGGTSVDFTQTLTTGFYVVEVRGGNSSPIENFQMGMTTGQFAAGAVAGGFADANTVGFGAFYLTAAQQVTIQVFGQPSYGADGAGGLRLTLLDAGRNVIASVP
jgi:sugar lactone lactonase YvrE